MFRSEILIKSDNVTGDVTLFDFVTGAQAGMHVRAGIKFITMGLFGDIKHGTESGASPTAMPEYKCAPRRRQPTTGARQRAPAPVPGSCPESGHGAGLPPGEPWERRFHSLQRLPRAYCGGTGLDAACRGREGSDPTGRKCRSWTPAGQLTSPEPRAPRACPALAK